MKCVAIFFIFLALWVHAVSAQTIITIEVQENGNALWNIENRLPLASQAAIDDWNDFIQKGQNPEQYRKDVSNFSEKIEWFLLSAENYSNRSMRAVKFNISYDTTKTLSGDFGIIRYSFEWAKFSRKDSEKIFIGDIFSEGMLLSSDNVLIIKIPDGYEVISTSPNFDKRDGNRLIWDGTLYRSFGKGEPAVVLQQTSNGTGIWLTIGIFVTLTAGSSLIFLRKKRDSIPENDSNADIFPLPPLTEEDLQYEDVIEQIIMKSGGQAYQSNIVKETGLSKSKISVVLAKMKEEGRILKIRRGKENLIRLVRK